MPVLGYCPWEGEQGSGEELTDLSTFSVGALRTQVEKMLFSQENWLCAACSRWLRVRQLVPSFGAAVSRMHITLVTNVETVAEIRFRPRASRPRA